jgi:hypothetical protein
MAEVDAKGRDMPRVTITLNEAEMRELADEAARRGLSTEAVAQRALAAHFRELAREREWRERLGAAFDALHASLPPSDLSEVEAEITAARREAGRS